MAHHPQAAPRVIQRMMTESVPADIRVLPTALGLQLAGRLEENGAAINGDVMLEEYTIDPSGAGKFPPLKGAHAKPGSAAALRVHNIEVNPKLLGLGDFLLKGSAEEASRRSIPYMLGMNCAGKARSWYVRMGFVPYSRHKNPEILTPLKQQIETQIRTEQSQEHLSMLLESHGSVQTDLESEEAKAMFAPVQTVIARAAQNIERRWMKVADNQYFAK